MKNFYLFSLFVILFLSLNIFASNDPFYEIKERCEKLIQNLDTVTNIDDLALCSDFYWHFQQLDKPAGSYNNIIKIGYRIIELDPNVFNEYIINAWLLYSQWIQWKGNPQEHPYGENKEKEAVEVLKKGMPWHANNAEYFWKAALTIKPIAQWHLPEYYSFVIENLEIANELDANNKLKARIRLDLAHVYRHQDKKELAIKWYRAVLEIDPENPIAKKFIKELQDNLKSK